MTGVVFKKLVEQIEKEDHETLRDKGEEYTQGNEDRLKNFKTIAAEIGTDPLTIWYVYFKKHVDSVANFVKTEETKSSEKIEGRLMDIRNYCALGRALMVDMGLIDLDLGETAITAPSPITKIESNV